MNDKTPPNEEFFSLAQAAEYARVSRQAIFMAIKERGLVAEKINRQWRIKRSDLDNYRANKYNRDLRKRDGEYLYDMEKGHFSVSQVCRILSQGLGKPYSLQHLYYLLRRGDLKAYRNGSAWIIEKEGAIALLEKEREKAGLNEKWGTS